MKLTLDEITSLAKRRGFIYQGSEIYGGLAGTWDYGPLGVALKTNIKKLWRKHFVETDGPLSGRMFEIESAILMNARVWEASGHASGFADPMVECVKCKRRFRADHIEGVECPECGGKLGEARAFNMMFKTQVGAMEDSSSLSYLRPETAQGMFVNFKNIVDTFSPKLPFGITQIGKAFRNEITPRDFTFRVREFEQMEIEYFIQESDWEKVFEEFRLKMHGFISALGLSKESIHEFEVPSTDLAHYSKRTIDFEYDYPFGRKELYGLAYRTDFDLKNHIEHSKVSLTYFDEESKERVTPHVIEPTFGLDRTLLALLCEHGLKEEVNGEERIYLKLPPTLSPVKVAVFPLVKNKPELTSKAREVFEAVKKIIPETLWDDNGNVGKRYRRQDEIGTPFCVTVDYDSLEKGTVTVRDRDSMEQEVVPIEKLPLFLLSKIV